MKEEYLQDIKRICPKLTDEDLHFLKNQFQMKTFYPKDFFHKQGEVSKELGQVLSGLFRVYNIDENGKEITFSFHQKGYVMGDFFQNKKGQPNRFFFECKEEAVVAVWKIENLELCVQRIPAFEVYYRQVLEEAFQRAYDRLLALLIETPEQRYRNFMREYPELNQRISVSDLCSYIGISRQTLTRLRKKVVNKS